MTGWESGSSRLDERPVKNDERVILFGALERRFIAVLVDYDWLIELRFGSRFGSGEDGGISEGSWVQGPIPTRLQIIEC